MLAYDHKELLTNDLENGSIGSFNESLKIIIEFNW